MVNKKDATVMVRKISPFDEEFDVKYEFDEVFENIKEYSDPISLCKVLDTLTAHHDNFIDSFGSVGTFQALHERSQHLVLQTLEAVCRASAEINQYDTCNGTAIFQIWLIAVIRKEQDSINHIETRLAKFRTNSYH